MGRISRCTVRSFRVILIFYQKIWKIFCFSKIVPIFAIPIEGYAEIAQLVERNLAKVEVAGPSPVFRSKSLSEMRGFFMCLPMNLKKRKIRFASIFFACWFALWVLIVDGIIGFQTLLDRVGSYAVLESVLILIVTVPTVIVYLVTKDKTAL